MAFASWVIIAKVGLDLAAGMALLGTGKAPQGLLFLSFILVDLATLGVSI